MKHLKTFESFNFDQVNEEEGLFRKKQKISPEEAIKEGENIVKKHPGKRNSYTKIAESGDEDKARKYLMFNGYNPNIKYIKWDSEATAPDDTKGYFVDSTKYSGQGSGGKTSPSA